MAKRIRRARKTSPVAHVAPRRGGARFAFGFLIFTFALLVSLPASAHDENIYFTGQLGSSSTELNDITDVGGSFESGTTASDISLDNSILVGVKAGIMSRSGLLGLEVEAFQTRPDIENQTQTFIEPSFGPFLQTRGGDHRVNVYAVNLVLRHPITKRLVAHVGAGPALVHSKVTI